MMQRDISQPWKCRGPADVESALVPLDQLDRARVATIFSRSKEAHSDVDTIGRLRRSNYACLDISSREFRRQEAFRIQFIPAGTDIEALPVHVRKTTFFVTTAVLTRCAFSIGSNRHDSQTST
jgi:hypothetical protein